MKKVFAFITASLMAMMLLAGCGGTASSTPATSAPAGSTSTAAPSGEQFKIYLITMDQQDQHWVNVDKGAQKAVEELGADKVAYKWLAPDVKDDAKQIEQINNAVADGADVILLAANGRTAVTSALTAAVAEGVKLVYVDSPADFEAAHTFATDNTAAGKTAGEEMLAALTAKGVTSGDIGIVGVSPSTDSTVQRETGFRSAFEGTDFNLLTTQYGEGDAVKSKDIASGYISQGVVAVFGTNEGSTVGTGNAIKEDGNNIVGVGFDKSDMIQTLIKGDSILCTMAQNPDVMGYDSVKFAYGLLAGTETADGGVTDTGVTVLNKEALA